MYSERINRLTLVFALIGLALVTGLFYRMILQGEDLASTPYIEQKVINKIYRAVDKAMITEENGGVVLDRQRLRKTYGAAFTRFLEARLSYLSFKDGKLEIEHSAFRVSNHRYRKGKMLADRGRILDREGRVLAETVTEENGSVRRNYPLGPAGFPLIGVAHSIYGLKGLEKTLDSWLMGEKKSGFLASIYRLISGRERTADVVLTIDTKVQQEIYRTLGEKTGAVVVLDVRNGEIIAAVSTPAFNPATPSGPLWEREEKRGYQGSFVDRTMQRRYPPGSTFKLVTAAAWADREEFDPKWGMKCSGRHKELGIRDHNKRGHGWVSLQTAVTNSCNVFFSDIGVQLGAQLLREANRFGFNSPWSPAGEKSVTLQSLAFAGYPRVNSGHEWRSGNFTSNPKLVAQGAIGQNVVMATPLQMALVMSAFGNKGVMMKPQLVKSAFYSDKNETSGLVNLWHGGKEEFRRSCRKDTAEILLEMMKKVMVNGTGYAIPKLYKEDGKYTLGSILPRGQETQLIGKTGTAETGGGMEDHSWFIGLAPAESPRYAVAALVEHGGLGAKVAGPIAAKAMEVVLNEEN